MQMALEFWAFLRLLMGFVFNPVETGNPRRIRPVPMDKP